MVVDFSEFFHEIVLAHNSKCTPKVVGENIEFGLGQSIEFVFFFFKSIFCFLYFYIYCIYFIL